MRIGLGQINSHLGSFAYNRQKMIEYVERAKARRCELIIFPEFSLFGYHPGDLLERESIVQAQLKEFQKLCDQMPKGIAAFVGLVAENKKKTGKKFINAAALIEAGKAPKIFAKELHPTYDVFDDHRHLEPGNLEKNFFQFKGKRIFVTICEDIWGWHPRHSSNPIKRLKGEEADLVINLSASPYTENKIDMRQEVVEQTAKFFKAPMVYVNMVGGQDELVFDGGSFAINAKGETLAQSAFFEEELNVLDLETNEADIRKRSKSTIECARQALVLGIRDFIEKTGLQKVHFGLSGGIDSALVACLAVDALGPQRVRAFALPSPYNADESLSLAKKLAENLGINIATIPIENTFNSAVETIESVLGKSEFGLMHENLQARLRGLFLMAYSNKENSLLLTTGNKSEYATGYTTLYGDMCGGLAPIADLVKGKVYEMCELYNAQFELIPRRIIDRPPSAELRPNQKDQDSLPEYETLDKAVEKMVEKCGAPRGETEKWVLQTMMKSEFKRWQAPPIIKVTDHAFGRGRRLPIAHKAFL